MPKQIGILMGRRKPNLRPRERKNRNLPAFDNTLKPSRDDLPKPKKSGDLYYLPKKIGTRLYQKSALGKLCDDGGILLNSEEVMFCHWHRHVPLPSNMWYDDQCKKNTDFLHKSILFQHIREGGVQLVPVENSEEWTQISPSEHTQYLKWRKDQNPKEDYPESQVIWVRSSNKIDWKIIEKWVDECQKTSTWPELYVIDDEFDVTMYLLKPVNPNGDLYTWQDLSDDNKKWIADALTKIEGYEQGVFIRTNEWPLTQLGLQHASGVFLRDEELNFLLQVSGVNSDIEDRIFSDLISRGLLIRPGFKYGTLWRAYDKDMKETHAEWLIQPESLSPKTWESLCLSIRLAEGVNKTWTLAIDTEKIKYLGMKRILPDKVLQF